MAFSVKEGFEVSFIQKHCKSWTPLFYVYARYVVLPAGQILHI